MSHGGRRPGAGRKKGVPNKKTAELQRAVEESGATPLEVLLASMRYHYGVAQAEERKQSRGNHARISGAYQQAAVAAKAAAPYIHPKISPVEHVDPVDEPARQMEIKLTFVHPEPRDESDPLRGESPRQTAPSRGPALEAHERASSAANGAMSVSHPPVRQLPEVAGG